jgi:hypothetical protein
MVERAPCGGAEHVREGALASCTGGGKGGDAEPAGAPGGKP